MIDELTLAMMSQLPKETIKEILNEAGFDEKFRLAKSPDLDVCGKVCYEVLAEDRSVYVRRGLAYNENLGKYPDIMVKLAKDPDVEVRRMLAENPDIENSPEAILILANDSKNVVREYLAENPAIANYPDIVKRWLDDSDGYLLYSICNNGLLLEIPEVYETCEKWGFL